MGTYGRYLTVFCIKSWLMLNIFSGIFSLKIWKKYSLKDSNIDNFIATWSSRISRKLWNYSGLYFINSKVIKLHYMIAINYSFATATKQQFPLASINLISFRMKINASQIFKMRFLHRMYKTFCLFKSGFIFRQANKILYDSVMQ